MASMVNGVYYSGDTSAYTEYLDRQDANLAENELKSIEDFSTFDTYDYTEEGMDGFDDSYLYQGDKPKEVIAPFGWELYDPHEKRDAGPVTDVPEIPWEIGVEESTDGVGTPEWEIEKMLGGLLPMMVVMSVFD